MEENNVIQLDASRKRNFQTNEKESFEKSLRSQGESIMNEDNYVTHKELENFEDKIDLKFDNINTKIDGAFNLTNAKIDHMQEIMNEKFRHTDTKIDNSINEFKIEMENNRKETVKWVFGIGIAIAGLIIGVLY